MMNLQHDEWAQVLRHLDTALDLPPPERQPWLAAQALPPHLAEALQRLLQDRGAIETADFLGAGAARSMLHTGTLLGPWRLQRELGRGGMASVWLAQRADGAHQRPVALKLPHRVFGTSVISERFARERDILSTLQHPNIAQVLDAGEAAGQPWLALEYVAGLPITEHALAAGLDTRARLALCLPVLQAVQHAHSQLVIHRDLKPANVLVAADGTVKLLDFGVAKLLAQDGASTEGALTQVGGRAMTPQYASPEQVAGRPLGAASDVYSLGVLLYELLTGRLPYTLQRSSAAALEEAILQAQVQRPSQAVTEPRTARALRGDVDTIVMKALAVQPAQRYTSAAALADDIQRHLQSLPIHARPARLAYRAGRWLRRHALAASAATALVLALAAGLASTLWQAERANREARSAQASSDFLARLFEAGDTRSHAPDAIARTTALELIQRGHQRLATELADAPEARARLLGTLADLYAGMGQLERAVQAQQEGVAAWRLLPGQALQVAAGMARVSGWLLAMDRDAEAEAQARAGLALLAAETSAMGPPSAAAERERGHLHTRLGDVLYRRDTAQAEREYRSAVALLSRHPVKEDEYPGALNGLAWVLMAKGEIAEALQLLQTMRSERVKRWGADTMLVAAVDRDLAQFQSAAGQLDEALQTSSRVMAALQRSADPASVELTTAQFGHGVILQDLGRHAEALAVFQATEKAFAARGDGNFVYRAGSQAAAAASLLELGRLAEARPLAQQAAQALGEKLPEHGMTVHALTAQARVLALDGRFAEAEQLYTRLHSLRAKDAPFRSRGRAMLFVRQAEMALQRGDTAAASAHLDAAAAAIQPASPWYAKVLDLVAARRAQGRAAAAPTSAASAASSPS